MNNSEIELELIQHFGLEKTIVYCEMSAFMYNLLYEDVMKVNPDVNLNLAYDYERDWWLKKHDELVNMNKTIKEKVK